MLIPLQSRQNASIFGLPLANRIATAFFNTRFARMALIAAAFWPTQSPSAIPEQPPTPSVSGSEISTNPRMTTEKLWTHPSPPVTWQITFKSFSTVSEEESFQQPLFVHITLIGKDSSEIVHYRNYTSEVWKIADRVFLSAPEMNDVTYRFPISKNTDSFTGQTPSLPLEDPDWTEMCEFKWITSEMYKGRMLIDGESMLIYSDIKAQDRVPSSKGGVGAGLKYPSGPVGGLPLIPGVKVAAISEGTLLPKYLQIGTEVGLYTFSKPEYAKVPIPPKVARQIEQPRTIVRGPKSISMIP